MIASSSIVVSLALVATIVSAHGLVMSIQGANGVSPNGFGVVDGVRREVQVLRQSEGCAKLDVASEMAAAIQAGVPTANADGSISMTYKQINANADGGGPITAFMDTTGTGNNFQQIEVTQDVATKGGKRNSEHPLTLQMPAGTTCAQDACLMRIQNPVGPFGSCFAVAPASGSANSTAGADANSSSSAAAPASTEGAASTEASSTSTGGAPPKVGFLESIGNQVEAAIGGIGGGAGKQGKTPKRHLHRLPRQH